MTSSDFRKSKIREVSRLFYFFFWSIVLLAEPIWGWLSHLPVVDPRGSKTLILRVYVGQFDPHFGPTKSLKKMAEFEGFFKLQNRGQ